MVQGHATMVLSHKDRLRQPTHTATHTPVTEMQRDGARADTQAGSTRRWAHRDTETRAKGTHTDTCSHTAVHEKMVALRHADEQAQTREDQLAAHSLPVQSVGSRNVDGLPLRPPSGSPVLSTELEGNTDIPDSSPLSVQLEENARPQILRASRAAGRDQADKRLGSQSDTEHQEGFSHSHGCTPTLHTPRTPTDPTRAHTGSHKCVLNPWGTRRTRPRCICRKDSGVMMRLERGRRQPEPPEKGIWSPRAWSLLSCPLLPTTPASDTCSPLLGKQMTTSYPVP